jgi:histidine triad (HIT) family protein
MLLPVSGRVVDRVRHVPECKFCAIARGELDARIVLEGDDTLAFLDHRPLFPGHLLLIPREHRETMLDAEPELLAALAADAQLLARAMEEALGADGSFVAVNNHVSQSVPHLHVHVVPRRRKDGLRGFFWPRTRYASDGEMATVAARITEQLGVIL